jgi:hypothetical protein
MAVSTEANGQGWRANRVGTAARDLALASFALVMATGIVSVGTFQLGPDWLSRVLLVMRLVRHRHPAEPEPGTPAATAPPSASPAPPVPRLPEAWDRAAGDSSSYQFRWDKPDKSDAEMVITDRKMKKRS